jgi:hypothetical protein
VGIITDKISITEISSKSGGGPPQSKTLARSLTTLEWREAFWSAPVPWRFGGGANTSMLVQNSGRRLRLGEEIQFQKKIEKRH